MTKTVTLVFAHGVGFCKEIWEPVMRRLRESPLLQSAGVHTEYVSFDFKYHGSNRDESETLRLDLSKPKSPRVHHSAGDLTTWTTAEALKRVHALKQAHPDRQLIGVGHSMGACALWNAEVQQPGTFDGLILFEPVYGDMNVEPITDFLVSITLQRQASWPTRKAAENHLRSFKNFSAWDSESLEAYMKGGLVEDASNGRTILACSPLREAALYNRPRQEQKVFFHSGGRSKMFSSWIFEEMTSRWPHIYSVGEPIPRSSHVMVMEKPAAVTQKILENLAQLEPFHATSRL